MLPIINIITKTTINTVIITINDNNINTIISTIINTILILLGPVLTMFGKSKSENQKSKINV